MTEAPEDFPFTFRCRRTGNCCARPEGHVFVTDEDVARIAAHVNLDEDAFRARFVAPSGDRLLDGLGPACVFLQAGTESTCAVYDARPEQCRTWPFWDELRDPKELRQAMRYCPGIALTEPG